jgi:hypothetical protein
MNLVLLLHLLSGLVLSTWIDGASLDAQSYTADPPHGCGSKNVTFDTGEEIVYKIYYHMTPFWIPAGEVSFRVEDAGRDYRFFVNAFTYKSYEWFYRGHYTFESYVEKRSLMPHVFLRTIEEKKFTRYNKYIFDQTRGKVTAWEGKSVQEAELSTHDVSPCMHDLISIIYYMRNMDFNTLKVGESIPIRIYIEGEYPLSVHILGIDEEKRIKGYGKLQTHEFSPEVIAGEVFNANSMMKVWVSADENKIPLMIESPVRIGKIKAVLESYSGLRHDLILNE